MTSSTSTVRRLQDAFLGLFGLGMVGAGMAAINETCRRCIFDAFHGDLPAIPSWLQFHTWAKAISQTLPIDNPSFVAFAVFAVVLMFFTFKM
jgi:hypothetical protein